MPMVEFGAEGEIINTAKAEFVKEQQRNVERLKPTVPILSGLFKNIRHPENGSTPDKTAMLVQVTQEKNPRVILAVATKVTEQLPPEHAHVSNPPKNHVNIKFQGFGIAAVDGAIRRVVTDGNTWREIDPSVDKVSGSPDNPDTLAQMRSVAKPSAPYQYDTKRRVGFLRIASNDEYKIQTVS